MSLTFTESITLVKMACDTCGVTFAVPENFKARRLKDHEMWYCPSGHRWQYTGQSEEEKLREQLLQQMRETSRERENYFAEQRKHEQTQKEMQRLKKRVGNGVCPCCKRTFLQLSRHMESKHPDFKTETA